MHHQQYLLLIFSLLSIIGELSEGHQSFDFMRKRQEDTQTHECNITASRHHSADRQNGSVDSGLSDSWFRRYSGGAGAWQLLVFTLLSGFHASTCHDRALYCLC